MANPELTDDMLEEDLQRMLAVGKKWLADHPCASLSFADIEAIYRARAKVPAHLSIGIIAALDEILGEWGCSHETRHLLRSLNAAPKHAKATYQMARVILVRLGLIPEPAHARA